MSEEEKQTKKVNDEALDPDLDALLDDALQDFSKPQVPKSEPGPDVDLASKLAAMGIGAAVSDSGGAPAPIWTEEFIQQATANFEQTMRALMEQQQGSGEAQNDKDPASTADSAAENPQLDMSSLSSQFAKFASASATEAQSDTDFTKCLADTMKHLSENNAQLKNPPTADDLNKMFENLGLLGSEEEGAMGGLFPLMQVMLENILSKEVLYPPMKEITEKYPDWLADHRSTLSEEDFTRYNKQYDIMKQVVELYEEEQESDSEEVKGQRFEKIVIFMQKLQEMGQPPKDLVGDMGPMINFDGAGNPVLPDVSSFLGAAGFPGGGTSSTSAPGDGTTSTSSHGEPGATDQPPSEGEQCVLM